MQLLDKVIVRLGVRVKVSQQDRDKLTESVTVLEVVLDGVQLKVQLKLRRLEEVLVSLTAWKPLQ